MKIIEFLCVIWNVTYFSATAVASWEREYSSDLNVI